MWFNSYLVWTNLFISASGYFSTYIDSFFLLSFAKSFFFLASAASFYSIRLHPYEYNVCWQHLPKTKVSCFSQLIFSMKTSTTGRKGIFLWGNNCCWCCFHKKKLDRLSSNVKVQTWSPVSCRKESNMLQLTEACLIMLSGSLFAVLVGKLSCCNNVD